MLHTFDAIHHGSNIRVSDIASGVPVISLSIAERYNYLYLQSNSYPVYQN